MLTHPARLTIFEILRDGEHCVCHMETHLGFRQAHIAQQWSVLRETGLIQDRRDGWNIFYRVADSIDPWSGDQQQISLRRPDPQRKGSLHPWC